jgi:hypothetical protein
MMISLACRLGFHHWQLKSQYSYYIGGRKLIKVKIYVCSRPGCHKHYTKKRTRPFQIDSQGNTK